MWFVLFCHVICVFVTTDNNIKQLNHLIIYNAILSHTAQNTFNIREIYFNIFIGTKLA